MIKAIAIDDEPLALKIIESFCAQSGEIQLLKSFTSQEEAKKYLSSFPADLIFLDIQMPQQDGISFYKELENKIPVIFTTAHSAYAVEGFNVNALDYLLKPFSYERFVQSLEKTKASLGRTKNEEDSIYLRADYQLHRIMFSDILYIQSDDDYIRVFAINSKPRLFRITLKEISQKLPASFIRIHRSYIVNSSKISRLAGKSVFIQDHELPMGANYEEAVRNTLK